MMQSESGQTVPFRPDAIKQLNSDCRDKLQVKEVWP